MFFLLIAVMFLRLCKSFQEITVVYFHIKIDCGNISLLFFELNGLDFDIQWVLFLGSTLCN